MHSNVSPSFLIQCCGQGVRKTGWQDRITLVKTFHDCHDNSSCQAWNTTSVPGTAPGTWHPSSPFILTTILDVGEAAPFPDVATQALKSL